MNRFLRIIPSIIPHQLWLPLWVKWKRTGSLIKYSDWNFPHSIFIETMTSCNRSCEYCAQSLKEMPGKSMERRVFLRVIERLQQINWSGQLGWHYLNEPLLDHRLPNLMRYAKEKLPHSKITLETNGDYLTEELAGYLIDCGLLHARIARHRPYSEERDERIKKIIQRWPDVFSEYTPGIDSPIYKLGDHLPIKSTEWHAVCNSPRNQLAIRWDGSVTLCCCDYRKEINYGNLMDKPLLDIWRQPQYAADRKMLRNGIRPHRICEKCSGLP